MNNNTIKAIDTDYNGHWFRSRLEARWAVFFDSLGVEWQYEPDGVVTSVGAYLPDFYLPKLDIMVEVKPYELEGPDKRKYHDIAESIVRAGTLGFVRTTGMPCSDKRLLLCAGRTYRGVYLCSGLMTPLAFCFIDDFTPDHTPSPFLIQTRNEIAYQLCHTSDMENAYAAAKRARFEHGHVIDLHPLTHNTFQRIQ